MVFSHTCPRFQSHSLRSDQSKSTTNEHTQVEADVFPQRQPSRPLRSTRAIQSPRPSSLINGSSTETIKHTPTVTLAMAPCDYKQRGSEYLGSKLCPTATRRLSQGKPLSIFLLAQDHATNIFFVCSTDDIQTNQVTHLTLGRVAQR